MGHWKGGEAFCNRTDEGPNQDQGLYSEELRSNLEGFGPFENNSGKLWLINYNSSAKMNQRWLLRWGLYKKALKIKKRQAGREGHKYNKVEVVRK